ncbi:bifunctional precorrin-2 dehydrogenase/sirohydrochlorin ferrochelatase [Maritimibacter alkaliphilus]|uniref:precorrin-2 dehydrogenase/sirohydrochlorin ferrochelatase family protein n=1 Tax=Maritimibacter alkaliphilus TaxID=404236 RepID=UPI001C98C736|nr:bifunctional precorrin-2 dehydrogenase/sirohydrochlorin ferrochelatase [Maritimibacter alkaliphilus]MBY6090078.1 siroheme synthase [Maritimibacter alkaliphilus]
MRHFPIFLNLSGQRIALSGGGDAALAKLRLLLKTEGRIHVYADAPDPQILDWAAAGRLTLHRRALLPSDLAQALLVYAADEEPLRDAEIAAMGRDAGVLVNIVDNLEGSAFITPAMVDRDPVTVAIGTEGAAPVLARRIKAGLEERLPASTGVLTRAAQAFRGAAEVLPMGRARRDFWGEYFDTVGPAAHDAGGAEALRPALDRLLADHLSGDRAKTGRITLAWTGWDDPEMLVMKTRRALDAADVVVHDADLAPAVLELARREADLVALQPDAEVPPLAAHLLHHAQAGLHVLYLSTRPLPHDLALHCRSGGVDPVDIPGLPGPEQKNMKESA